MVATNSTARSQAAGSGAGAGAGDRLCFGDFCLDHAQGRLVTREGARPIPLTPKAFDLLHYLASRAGMLVKKDELMSALWSDTIVGDASIKVAVREIRKALSDSAGTPKYIETVHRRGYRFVAPMTVDEVDAKERASAPPLGARTLPASSRTASAPASDLAGRERELRQLMEQLGDASNGQRRCVLLSGAPGSGKTALIEAFVRQIASFDWDRTAPVLMLGHCFEQFGAGEPYLPVWEAIARAAKDRNESPLASLVARHSEQARSAEEPAATADSRPSPAQRLLRDLIDAIESIASETTVLLVLEDVQWVDLSTLDLLSALARRGGGTASGNARLMLLVTCRPPAADEENDHPLREVLRELLASRLAEQITLAPLDQAAVEHYVAQRFPQAALPRDFAQRLYQRTEGHPLFLVRLLDELVVQGIVPRAAGDRAWVGVLESQIPTSVRALIDAQFERLDDGAQHVLEAAAVAGVEASAAAIAAGVESLDPAAVEQICDELTRRGSFLRSQGVADWPDGTTAARYRFLHELYRDVVYQRIGEARRVRLHRALGVRLEAAWDERAASAGEVAAELAMHCERGRDWPRAVKYLRYAADAAGRQYAHREVVAYLRRAQAALEYMSTEHRDKSELPILVSLGANLQMLKGWAAPEVKQVYERADAMLSASSALRADVRLMFPVLWGVWLFHKVRSDLDRAAELAERLHALAVESGDPSLVVQAHQAMCVTALCQGHPAVTRDHMRAAEKIYDPARDAANTRQFGQDPGVATQAFGGIALWLLGDDDAAGAASERSLEWARQTNQPSSHAIALHFAAMLHQLRGDTERTSHFARRALELAEAEEFPFWCAGALVLGGWSAAATGIASGIDQIRQGVDAWLATGSRTYQPYYLGLHADALLRLDRAEEALAVLDEAIGAARSLPEGLYEAELLRLKASAVRRSDEKRELLDEAIAVARQQGANALEARASADLRAAQKKAHG